VFWHLIKRFRSNISHTSSSSRDNFIY